MNSGRSAGRKLGVTVLGALAGVLVGGLAATAASSPAGRLLAALLAIATTLSLMEWFGVGSLAAARRLFERRWRRRDAVNAAPDPVATLDAGQVRALRRLGRAHYRLARGVVDQGARMAAAAAEIARTTEQLAHRVTGQAVHLSGIAADAGEVVGGADPPMTEPEVGIGAGGARHIDMREPEQRLHDVRTRFQAVTHEINVLQGRIGRVERIAGITREVAEQTGLLALNTVMEAVRAGERGRGFAVAADEVRRLAGRTRASTTEIDRIIEAINSETARAARTMIQLEAIVEAASRYAGEARHERYTAARPAPSEPSWQAP